ncbi:AraC family transcriptional regulator [Celeribacter ethanolicus]|uniref:AraC family transcriptional regulator n=1 Tax=Celeribacter ethanolicus TaxID=1758178 RepID=A0A291GCA6_9RHOB|nr:AraC family transcriptional regulator [Celeribacter ethanolicus]ATG48029.1 AraC family transcriptional regulator [Celeribacter ethanolicus]
MARHAYEDRLLRVLDHVYAHLDGDLSLDTLADVAALSRFHFHRVFSAMTGETVAGFIRRVRLYKASHLLVRSEDGIERIAQLCGYPNPRSFARAFQDAFGLTPTAFRARGVEMPPLRLTEKGDYVMYEIKVEDRAPASFAGVAHRGDYTEIGQAFEVAAKTALSRGMGPVLGPMVGVYFSNPGEVPVEEMRSMAGFILTGDATLEAPLDPFALTGGRYAVLRHVGPYTGLRQAYDYLYGKWLPESGEEPRDGPPFEIYENTPMDTAPEDLVTLICAPIQ